jgi:hypothetical protein
MTQEDKELLLKDLCARLPYGTLVYAQNADDWYDDEISTQVLSDAINEDYVIKPYLFPLSSMTEEQKRDYQYITERWMNDPTYTIGDSFDWLNKNHFDYRGLIEKGLAIDATGLSIY